MLYQTLRYNIHVCIQMKYTTWPIINYSFAHIFWRLNTQITVNVKRKSYNCVCCIPIHYGSTNCPSNPSRHSLKVTKLADTISDHAALCYCYGRLSTWNVNLNWDYIMTLTRLYLYRKVSQ